MSAWWLLLIVPAAFGGGIWLFAYFLGRAGGTMFDRLLNGHPDDHRKF